MDKRRIGRSDLTVAPFCLGGNVFGWTADEATSFAILDRFVERGFDFIDTANVYSRWAPGHVGGESETVIGRWFAARPGARDRVVLATKVGMDMGEAGKGLSAQHIEQACEASLRRLQTDRIDLYQSHLDDADVPLDETLRAYERLIADGKVRAIGASNYGAKRLKEALSLSATASLPRYECLQPDYSLAERRYEAQLEPLCRAEQVGVIGYFSLAAASSPASIGRPRTLPAGPGRTGSPITSTRGASRCSMRSIRLQPRTGRARPRWRWPGSSPGRASPRRSPVPPPCATRRVVGRGRTDAVGGGRRPARRGERGRDRGLTRR